MCVKYNLNDELIIRMPLYLFVQFPHSLINSGCSSVRIYAFLSKYYIYNRGDELQLPSDGLSAAWNKVTLIPNRESVCVSSDKGRQKEKMINLN